MRRAAALFLRAGVCAFGQHYEGFFDSADCSTIAGWAWNWDIPNTPIQVDIYDGSLPVATVQANVSVRTCSTPGRATGGMVSAFRFPQV